VLDFKKDFMSNAPVGQIFAATAENLKPQYLGRKTGPTRVAVENVINRVQQGKLKTSAAWAEAVKEAQKASTS
jgi:cellobiose transport system substrate-binding protein